MDTDNAGRCCYFETCQEPLAKTGGEIHDEINLCVPHCHLADRLVEAVRGRGDAVQLTSRMTVRTADGRDLAFVGPDLQAVTSRSCTRGRCRSSCQPAYDELLRNFEIVGAERAATDRADEDGTKEPAARRGHS